jgi:hypothetical protein
MKKKSDDKPSKKTTKKPDTDMVKEMDRALSTDVPKGPAGKHVRLKLAAQPPANEDPRDELKRLVQEHVALTKKATAIANMSTDRKSRTDGAVIPSRVPADVKVEMDRVVEIMKKRAEQLESKMLRQLRQVPVYKHFLAKVFGVGPVVAAYLVAEVDITRSVKVSQLRRFCGLAVIDGRLERPRAGIKLGYNSKLRVRLYQAFSAMWKNAAKKTTDAPCGSTTKYLAIWTDYKHRMAHSERYDATKNKLANFDGAGVRPGAKALIHAAGWHKAADVFIEDLYIVWRALEGLPVWPSYHAAKLGYEHGGKIVKAEPRMLSLEEALEVVGDVGARPLAGPVGTFDAEETIDMGDEGDELLGLDEEAIAAE